MSTRTTERLVTFSHPFLLGGMDETQPAGTYRVVTDEDEILGLSFVAFQRTATMLHTPAVSVASATRQVFTIEPDALEEALEADVARSGISPPT